MNIKYANMSGVVAHAGLRISLSAGEAWDASDPLVQARPDLFDASPSTVRTTGPTGFATVEQATAGPGEQRATRRAR